MKYAHWFSSQLALCLIMLLARSAEQGHRAVDLLFAVALLLSSHSALAQCVDQPARITAWWPPDEASGRSGGAACARDPRQDTVLIGGALRFDGQDDCLAVADDDRWAIGRNDLTIELWGNSDKSNDGSASSKVHKPTMG